MDNKSDSLLESLRSGKKVYEEFFKVFKEKYLINGLSFQELEKKFRLSIPENLSLQECRGLESRLLDLHQEASFYKASSRATTQALKKGSDTEYRIKYSSLVASYEAPGSKLPAAKTLEALAKNHTDDVDSAIMAASIALDFWEDILSHLAFCRKILENIIIGYSIEAKLK